MYYKYNVEKGGEVIKSKWQRIALTILGLSVAAALAMSGGGASAASTIIVTPANQQGWSTADTRPGGNVTFVNDLSSPLPAGALRLTTNATNSAKAQYMHAASTPLSDITELSYSTKQVSSSFAGGDPSFQIPVLLDGTPSSFTTLVYEPYQGGGAPVVNGVWQSWDVDAGQLWSSRNASGGGACSTNSGAGGPPFYTLASLKAVCPNAVVVGFGVNAGTFNPSYDVETDAVNFNGTVYDFQTAPIAVTLNNKDDCKNGGWATANNPSFKNQGDCVSYFATKNKNQPNGSNSYTHFTYGSVTLDNPVQQLNFSGYDNGASASDQGTVTYTNTNPAFSYTAPLTCVRVSGNTANFAYQIPGSSPVAANIWVVWKVVDNSPDAAGFTTAPDMNAANALCESGSFSPTNYAITAGDIVVQ